MPAATTRGGIDNRIAIHVASSQAYENNDFFDYIIPPLSYASLTGQVWNDANANATNDVGEVGIKGVTVRLVSDLNGNGIADPGEPTVAVTQTDSSGTYICAALSAGNYVVVETDPPGYISIRIASRTVLCAVQQPT